MTFRQAEKKLAKIAKGEYHTIRFAYNIDSHIDDDPQYPKRKPTIKTQCDLYIHKIGWHSGSTWDEAFVALDAAMNPRPAPVEKMPDVSDTQPREVANA